MDILRALKYWILGRVDALRNVPANTGENSCVGKAGDYILSIHAENELADDNLTERDIEAAILNGDIVSRERDRVGRPKYLIEGTTLEGKGLTAVVQLFQIRQLVVIITVYET